MRPPGSPQELERRRVRALALIGNGLAPVEVARRLGVDRRSVRRWKKALMRDGVAGVRAKPAPGRPPKLTAAHKAELRVLLRAGARAAGFAAERWSCARVAQLIERHFGVRYHVDHVGRLLRELNRRTRAARPAAG